ncbi:protein FAR-RED IMPAIRED RESPONSE 1-like [Chenopodium quinoa]|uniref:protein FAR-RED IMPAIRED RESPONSE 1-like n=1 Tax=Chenopodium quinoa TaxID=63459 RepID=UPI000B773271|nr:protein FAR-RED IMPAIRED RESPONSE 1-like [Chenopodium quinoa]
MGTDNFDSDMEPVIGGIEAGVVDWGSGVKFRNTIDVEVEDVGGEGIEDIVVKDVVVGTDNVTGHGETDDSNAISVRYLSPMKTIHTTHTVVGSNQMTVLTVEEPKLGMVFKCWQEIEAYYKEYAEQIGFGVTRVQGVNSKQDKSKRIATIWKCECWGRPDMRARREAKKRAKAMGVGGAEGLVDGDIYENELSRAKRTSKKCECLARIYASLNEDGAWELKTVHLEHNHLIDPAQAKLVKEYRMKHITSKVKKRLMDFYEQGVPISQIHGCMATERNGVKNMSFTVKDLQHEVYKARRLKMVGGDAVAMMEFFQKMQAGNQNLFHAQRLDEEGRLKDVLWVDARSRVAYEEFGDVVCFDTTYLTNEYEFPFANFVGVNHHGQTLLLGCALISHEDCDTFEWVFRQWLACMNNRPPEAILTNQAAAMRRPLLEVMPNTIHRWCIWHIMSKIPEKLGKCGRYQDFVNLLKAVVYESFTPMEFHDRWAELISEYNLEENDWLQKLHKESYMWVPSYMKEFFWVGMKTTQRVESIHRFFDGYVNRQTKLHEFPQKYCMALNKRLQDEESADDRCSRRLVSGFKVEEIFRKLYTDIKFQEVQKQCSRMMYCSIREKKVLSESLIHYLVRDRVWIVPPGASEDDP